MAQILTPGYVYWDGTKYIFDPVSPADRTGPPGPPGPEGPPGGSFTAGGDLVGTSSSQTVVGFQGRPVGSTAPTAGQVYAYDGDSWEPTDAGGGTNVLPLSSALFVDGSFPSGTIAGTFASVDSLSNGQAFISGVDLMTPEFIGKPITFSGADSSANNGTFLIISVSSSANITIYNPSAVAPDLNNSSISWAVSSGSEIVEGTAATIDSASAGVVTITGLTDITSEFIGKRINITNTGSNNGGSFVVINVNSPTSLDIYNEAGSAPDANDGAIVWTFRDGSVSKPFRTLQQAVTSAQYNNPSTATVANLLVSPGSYNGFSIATGGGADITISALGNTFGSVQGGAYPPYNGGILISTDISVDGGEGSATLSLKDAYTDLFSYTPATISLFGGYRQLMLQKSTATLNTATAGADRVIMYDQESFLYNISDPVYVSYKGFSVDIFGGGDTDGTVSASIHAPWLYRLYGVYNVYVILTVTSAATTGDITVALDWSDSTGNVSENIITSFSATSIDRTSVVLPLTLLNSDLVYTVTLASITGTVSYTLTVTTSLPGKTSP